MTFMELASDYITIDGLMEEFHIRSKTTVHRLIALGLPVHQMRPRGRLLFRLDEVQAWMDQSRCIAPAPDQGVA